MKKRSTCKRGGVYIKRRSRCKGGSYVVGLLDGDEQRVADHLPAWEDTVDGDADLREPGPHGSEPKGRRGYPCPRSEHLTSGADLEVREQTQVWR